jgi:hypothetical protein
MHAAAWWLVATAVLVAAAAVVMPARFRVGPVGRAQAAVTGRRESQRRAEALLMSWLSPRQREQYRLHGWFDVVTRGGNRYRIRAGRVVRLGAQRAAYCIEAPPWVPAADQLLAKKLLLETDERRFLATAHRYR